MVSKVMGLLQTALQKAADTASFFRQMAAALIGALVLRASVSVRPHPG